MATPTRSLTLWDGLKYSSFAVTTALQPSVTLFSRTRGVPPINYVTSFAIFIFSYLKIKTSGDYCFSAEFDSDPPVPEADGLQRADSDPIPRATDAFNYKTMYLSFHFPIIENLNRHVKL
jgi:hypothetical protein